MGDPGLRPRHRLGLSGPGLFTWSAAGTPQSYSYSSPFGTAPTPPRRVTVVGATIPYALPYMPRMSLPILAGLHADRLRRAYFQTDEGTTTSSVEIAKLLARRQERLERAFSGLWNDHFGKEAEEEGDPGRQNDAEHLKVGGAGLLATAPHGTHAEVVTPQAALQALPSRPTKAVSFSQPAASQTTTSATATVGPTPLHTAGAAAVTTEDDSYEGPGIQAIGHRGGHGHSHSHIHSYSHADLGMGIPLDGAVRGPSGLPRPYPLPGAPGQLPSFSCLLEARRASRQNSRASARERVASLSSANRSSPLSSLGVEDEVYQVTMEDYIMHA